MNLTCPYCGSSIDIEEFYDYGGTTLQIRCDNWGVCGALWSRGGELMIPPQAGG